MLDIVVSWLNNLGVAVVYHHDQTVENQYCNTTKQISIKVNDDKQQQLFSLLHEAGHAILNWNQCFHKEAYPWKHHKDPDIQLWLKDLLQEEYDAWQEGWELSKKLNLNLDLNDYELCADDCLNSYRSYATTVNNFSQKLFNEKDPEFDIIFNHIIKLLPKQ